MTPNSIYNKYNLVTQKNLPLVGGMNCQPHCSPVSLVNPPYNVNNNDNDSFYLNIPYPSNPTSLSIPPPDYNNDVNNFQYQSYNHNDTDIEQREHFYSQNSYIPNIYDDYNNGVLPHDEYGDMFSSFPGYHSNEI